MKRWVRSWGDPLLRALRVPSACKLGYKGMDDKLARYIDFKEGCFLEAGANDGLSQSNTYFLERIRGWRGILVEPVPELYARCCQARPQAQTVQAALVAHDYPEAIVHLATAGLMTMVKPESGNTAFSERHIEKGLQNEELDQSKGVEAPARTLDAIIEDSGVQTIDFMSLDLEGYEPQALRGLNLEKNGPQWLLIEVRDIAQIEAVLKDHYVRVATLSQYEAHADILYRKKTPE